MKRSLFALRCTCGKWQYENRRHGLKRLRCSKCKTPTWRMDRPLFTLAIVYTQKKAQKDLPLWPGDGGRRRAEYGEWVALDHRHGNKETLDRVAKRCSFSVNYMSSVGVHMDPATFKIIGNDFQPHFGRRPRVSIAWHAEGVDTR